MTTTLLTAALYLAAAALLALLAMAWLRPEQVIPMIAAADFRFARWRYATLHAVLDYMVTRRAHRRVAREAARFVQKRILADLRNPMVMEVE